MTKKLTKTQKQAAWRDLPPAIICKPLRFIRDNTPRVEIKDPLGNIVGFDDSAEYKAARHAANIGAGACVQASARRLHMALA